MGMGFAPTWLRQVSPASHDHFNHWPTGVSLNTGQTDNIKGEYNWKSYFRNSLAKAAFERNFPCSV